MSEYINRSKECPKCHGEMKIASEVDDEVLYKCRDLACGYMALYSLSGGHILQGWDRNDVR